MSLCPTKSEIILSGNNNIAVFLIPYAVTSAEYIISSIVMHSLHQFFKNIIDQNLDFKYIFVTQSILSTLETLSIEICKTYYFTDGFHGGGDNNVVLPISGKTS